MKNRIKTIPMLLNGKNVHARVLPARLRLVAHPIKLPATPALRGRRQITKPEPIPESMAGLSIVWSGDGSRIKGHGKTIAEARAMAGAPQGARWVIQKVPRLRGFQPLEGEVIV